jgi:hypothetical protein
MLKRALFILFGMMLVAGISARADQGYLTPIYKGPMTPAEQGFVKSIQADLMKRFPTSADAEKAGYVRYTSEDDTGAISYANPSLFATLDQKNPSQLWYDKGGNLLGADFSELKTSDARPSLFGVNPGRLWEFDGHVHYVLRDTDGAMHYDKWVWESAYKSAGGDPAHPTAATLVKMGKADNAQQVATVFDFPTVWDLIVWVKPNPSGAFAYKNPSVKP